VSDCPSCGRHAGPHEACPHCGARLGGRTSIRSLKAAALLLAFLGLPALWLAATQTEVPQVSIADVTGALDMAYVRLSGVCSRAATYDAEDRSLSFWVADPTGEIYVAAYGAQADEIASEGEPPYIGDLVAVAGSLGLQEDFSSLTIHLPADLQVSRPLPVDRAVASLTTADEYRRVRVRGLVRSLQRPYEGLRLVSLRDESGRIDAALNESHFHSGTEWPNLEVGQAVELTAAVTLYRGEAQLSPASPEDLVLLEDSLTVAAEEAIGDLAPADAGRFVAIGGTVVDVRHFSAGSKYTVDDGTGTLVLLLWADLLDALAGSVDLLLGCRIEAQGEVSLYAGELQVVPELPQDIYAEEPAALAPSVVPIGSLTSSDEGSWVTVHGTLGQPEPFSSGVKYSLSDSTGSVVLLLWQEVYEKLADTGLLFPAGQVEATGRVDWYQGTLEIVPDAEGVTAIE
jgi:DNA/RNA endonuclease YhcR with UshA esterase domain